MGIYLNPGKQSFQMSVNSEIFVDKSEMLLYLNSLVNTQKRYVSVSRPRRFGKTMAADMMSAYYGKGADRDFFAGFKLAKNEDWDKYLGKFDVIRLVMTDFMGDVNSVSEMIDYLNEEVTEELMELYPEIRKCQTLRL